MLILIAESKTMAERQTLIPAEILENHTPAGEANADMLMARVNELSSPDLAKATGLTSSLAAKLRTMSYEFPNKSLGYKAIEAYTGIVFKALAFDTLDSKARNGCNDDVRIISSLYGVLKPDDVIKPYRLDFTSKIAPGDTALNAFWKKDVTIQLVTTIKESGVTELLNLLPNDAGKSVDWKIVKRFCKVWKVDFVEVAEGDKTKTPNASKLKTMRGELLRQILQEDIKDIETLRRVTSDNYICQGTPVYPDHLQFIC